MASDRSEVIQLPFRQNLSLAGAKSATVQSAPLNAVILKAAFRLRRGDETSHCQSAHTCIDSDHLCIEEVVRKAWHWPDIRWRTALLPLRMRSVRARCELHGRGRAYPHYEAHAVSGQFATDFSASDALISGCRRKVCSTSNSG
jgi:hypothetical protein